jgi:hypothetical protein
MGLPPKKVKGAAKAAAAAAAAAPAAEASAPAVGLCRLNQVDP